MSDQDTTDIVPLPPGGSPYRVTPSSAALNELKIVLHFLPYFDEGLAKKGRKMKSSKRVKYWIDQGKNTNDRDITFKSKAGEITISVPHVDTFNRDNPGLLKQFAFFTQLVRATAAHRGELIQDKITFGVKRLVELKIYSTEQSARIGFDNAADTLKEIGIKGTFKQGRGKRFIVRASDSIFPQNYRDNAGNCTVELSKTAPWRALLESNTVFPDYPFTLGSRAWALADLVFTLARQNMSNILDKGFFTISAEAIRCRLALPRPDFGKDPWRDGPEAMKTAARKLAEAHRLALNNSDLVLAFEHKEKGKTLTETNASEFLQTAQLKVSIGGQLLDELCKVSGRRLKPPQAKGESNGG